MRRVLYVFAVAALAGCGSYGTTPPPATPPPSPGASAASTWPVGWTLPNRSLTPGALATGYTVADICPHVNPALEAARPSATEVRQVYQRYGITSHHPGQFEADHLVPIELLGAPDDPRNMWPEPNDTPAPDAIHAEHLSPAFVHNSKDILEDVLHRDVCDGSVPLAAAQQAIASDWRKAYARYVGLLPAR